MRKLLKFLLEKNPFRNKNKIKKRWEFSTNKDLLKEIKNGVNTLRRHDCNYYKYMHKQYKLKLKTIKK
jgi:hypothetical protein